MDLIELTKYEEATGDYLVNLSSVSSLTCLLYDILLTTDEEVRLIWPKPWTHMKFLYFFLRYFSVAVQLTLLALYLPPSDVYFPLDPATGRPRFSPHACRGWQVYQSIAAFFLTIAVDVVLIVRVMSIYSSPVLRSTVGVCFALEVVAMCVSLALCVPGIQFNEICLVTKIPESIVIYAAASISFQSFLLVLTLFKFVQAVRQGWGQIPIIVLIVRDGLWGYLLIFAMMVSQAGLSGVKNQATSGIIFTWILSAFSFVGYRILLNLSHLSPEHDTTTDVGVGTSQFPTLHVEATTQATATVGTSSGEQSGMQMGSVTRRISTDT